MGQYKFRIIYTPGKENNIADGLNRRPNLYQEKAETKRAIFKENNRNIIPIQ